MDQAEGMTLSIEQYLDLLHYEYVAAARWNGERIVLGTVEDTEDGGKRIAPNPTAQRCGLPADGLAAPSESALLARIAERLSLPSCSPLASAYAPSSGRQGSLL